VKLVREYSEYFEPRGDGFKIAQITRRVAECARQWKIPGDDLRIEIECSEGWGGDYCGLRIKGKRLETDREYEKRLEKERAEAERVARKEAEWSANIEDAFRLSKERMKAKQRTGLFIAPCILRRDGKAIYANVPMQQSAIITNDSSISLYQVRKRLLQQIPGFEQWMVSFRPTAAHAACPMPRNSRHITLCYPGEYSSDGTTSLDR
jgi:hypothetical protein